MDAQQTYIDISSNNIANVNTTGFKKSRANFQDLMYQVVRAPGTKVAQGVSAPAGIEVGLGTRLVSSQKLFTTGSMKPTENQLDVAVNGPGFFQVTLPDGTLAYTRDGAFHKDENGQLVTASGFLIEPNISFPAEVTEVTIGSDGTVSGRDPAQTEPVELGQIQLANFINPAGLISRGGNLFVESGASGPAVVGNPGENGIGELYQGALETGNVKVVEEMINLIAAQRAFEINSKTVKAADEMLRQLAALR